MFSLASVLPLHRIFFFLYFLPSFFPPTFSPFFYFFLISVFFLLFLFSPFLLAYFTYFSFFYILSSISSIRSFFSLLVPSSFSSHPSCFSRESYLSRLSFFPFCYTLSFFTSIRSSFLCHVSPSCIPSSLLIACLFFSPFLTHPSFSFLFWRHALLRSNQSLVVRCLHTILYTRLVCHPAGGDPEAWLESINCQLSVCPSTVTFLSFLCPCFPCRSILALVFSCGVDSSQSATHFYRLWGYMRWSW